MNQHIPISTGDHITVNFDTEGWGGGVLGSYDKRTVAIWNGHPAPKLGERWECQVATVWDSGRQGRGLSWGAGMLVRPLRLLNPYPLPPIPIKHGHAPASQILTQRGNSTRGER